MNYVVQNYHFISQILSIFNLHLLIDLLIYHHFFRNNKLNNFINNIKKYLSKIYLQFKILILIIRSIMETEMFLNI
jgi:hypothetical protein